MMVNPSKWHPHAKIMLDTYRLFLVFYSTDIAASLGEMTIDNRNCIQKTRGKEEYLGKWLK